MRTTRGWPYHNVLSLADYIMAKKHMEAVTKTANKIIEEYWNSIPDKEKRKIDVDFGVNDNNT